MHKILDFIKLLFFVRKWREHNINNHTYPGNLFNMENVNVGNYSYGELNVKIYGKTNNNLIIGNYCSIADKTTFLLDGGHSYTSISTFPFKEYVLNQSEGSLSKGDIIIDDDVWIGYGSTILSGVHIGQGAVVAAGTVVTTDIPPYAIVGGVPAKVIKYRFTPELIEELLKIDYSKLIKEQIQSHINDLYEPLKDKSQLDWMEKKF